MIYGVDMATLPFADKPLKLPMGEKLKKLEYVNVFELEGVLKSEGFTGYGLIENWNYGLQAGGKGKILFISGDIIAASYDSEGNVYSRTDALERMFNHPQSNVNLYSYDETDIWLAVEMNTYQLFEYEPPEKEEIVVSEQAEEVPQEQKVPQEAAQESGDSMFVVTFKKEEKKLSREELMSKYRLKEMTDDDADSLINNALGD